MSSSRTRIFAYGTLMRGFCRHQALQDQTFLGVARTVPRYRMVNCGDYPGLLDDEPGIAIWGEVWEVTPECLMRLDEVEGVDEKLYVRKPIRLQAPFDQDLVLAYFYARSTEGLPDCGDRWI
jgi:gamma-glutamylcyclotransferase (GGCT)/AIG2-like uncharacterized protein YtfP